MGIDAEAVRVRIAIEASSSDAIIISGGRGTSHREAHGGDRNKGRDNQGKETSHGTCAGLRILLVKRETDYQQTPSWDSYT